MLYKGGGRGMVPGTPMSVESISSLSSEEEDPGLKKLGTSIHEEYYWALFKEFFVEGKIYDTLNGTPSHISDIVRTVLGEHVVQNFEKVEAIRIAKGQIKYWLPGTENFNKQLSWLDACSHKWRETFLSP